MTDQDREGERIANVIALLVFVVAVVYLIAEYVL